MSELPKTDIIITDEPRVVNGVQLTDEQWQEFTTGRLLGAKCANCETIISDPDCYAPDPYAYDIHGDATPVWECIYCRAQSADDI